MLILFLAPPSISGTAGSHVEDMFRGKKVKEQKAPSPEINMKRGEMAEESKGNVQSILLSSPDKPIRQSKLPGTPDLENMEPMLFHRDMDDEDDEEAQEDAKILNMSLIRGILGQSSNRLEDSPLTSPDRDDPYSPSKKVSFQQDVGSVASSQADEEKTHDELVNKIGKLQAKLTHAGIDNSAEKAMRRKKEKSLVKLAKELNKRSTDQQGKEVIINEVSLLTVFCQCFFSRRRPELTNNNLHSSRESLPTWKPSLPPLGPKWTNALPRTRRRPRITTINSTTPIESTELSLRKTTSMSRSWPRRKLPKPKVFVVV